MSVYRTVQAITSSFLLVALLAVAGTAFAQSPQDQGQSGMGSMGHGFMPGVHIQGGDDNDGGRGHGRRPGVFGTVTAINGSTITIEHKDFGPNRQQDQTSQTATTYTIDASGATVYKDQATASVSDIAVGDTIMAEGTVNGTDVTATTIRDGIPPRGGREFGPGGQGMSLNSIIQGNGEPVIGGTISAINGSSLTITNASNVTYTVDASSAKIIKQNATSSVSDLATGDSVIVQGTVNGTDVTASSVIDHGTPQAQSANANSNVSSAGNPGQHEGMFGHFMGVLGGFFHNLFGFF